MRLRFFLFFLFVVVTVATEQRFGEAQDTSRGVDYVLDVEFTKGSLQEKVFINQENRIDPIFRWEHMRLTMEPNTKIKPPFHPHCGHESVTYILKGASQYYDYKKNGALLKKGDISWLSTGSCIWHVEFPANHLMESGGDLETIQIWLQTPHKDHEDQPRYQDIATTDLPKVDYEGYTVKVLAGSLERGDQLFNSPLQSKQQVLFLDVTIEPHKVAYLPIDNHLVTVVYLYEAQSVLVGSNKKKLKLHSLAKLEEGQLDKSPFIRIEALDSRAKVLVLASVPVKENLFAHNSLASISEEKFMEVQEKIQSDVAHLQPPEIFSQIVYKDQADAFSLRD